MPGPWDDVVKELLRKSPEQFAEWLVAEGAFVAALSVELKRRDTQIYADGLFRILVARTSEEARQILNDIATRVE
jgi:hypothetical protein